MQPEYQNELLRFQQDMSSDRPALQEWERLLPAYTFMVKGTKKTLQNLRV